MSVLPDLPKRSHSQSDIEAVWSAYLRDKDEGLRNQLVVHYLDIVRFMATRMAATFPKEIDPGDLFSFGVFGLIDAIKGFDPGLGISFNTYASPRVRGAMLDGIRDLDWTPRLRRSRTRTIETVKDRLRVQNGVEPSVEEIEKELGFSQGEFAKILADSKVVQTESIFKTVHRDWGKQVSLGDTLSSDKEDDKELHLKIEEVREILAKHVARIDRIVITLYFFEEYTLNQIAEVLGVSESRMSQVLSMALANLKSILTRPEKCRKWVDQE